TDRSPSPLLDMTTTATGLLCWRDSHPLKWQLASLHQNPRKRPRTRKQYLPAPAPNVTPSITSPGASSIARVSSTRADPGPTMPPMPAIRGDFWIFAGRAARSRSNNLVISTTEQHAALPYQGCAGRRLAAVRIDLG